MRWWNWLRGWIGHRGQTERISQPGQPPQPDQTPQPGQLPKLGRRGELWAAHHVRQRGWRVLACPYRCPIGEIDLIALDRATVVFVEVKTRSSENHGQPWEAVDRKKRRHVTRAAVYFLMNHPVYHKQTPAARFDVIAITWPSTGMEPQFEHFADAYPVEGPWSV